MNMFKAVKAKSVEDYFEMLPPDRLKTMKYLDDFIRKNAPKLKPNFIYNMPGYGSFKYKNYKKEVIDWPTVSIANNKNYISLYVCTLKDGKYVAEKYKEKLGNVSVGKSCIRFKKIEDLNLDTLRKVIKIAETSPGITPPR